MAIVVKRPADRSWTILSPEEKLRARGTLPGAHVFDHAAHVVRVLQAEGADALALLPLVMPGSWLVNARGSARVFRAWLSGQPLEAWRTILTTIDESVGPESWLDLPASAKDGCANAAQILARVGEGAALAEVTKVLALFRPQVVPLMDDAALVFALGEASSSLFAPMMDWFSRSVLESEKDLIALATKHTSATLDAAQVLDRLLWFESTGWSADPRFVSIARDDEG
jgi:hypothetical protein